MSVSWNGPSFIAPETGSAHSLNYEFDVNQNDAYTGYTSRTYEHPANQQNPTAGITFYYNATTAKQYINVNIVGNTGSPDYVVNTTTNTGGSGISEVEYTTGDEIQTWSTSYSGAPLCIFTTTSAMNFVVGSGAGTLSITNSGSLSLDGADLRWLISAVSGNGDYFITSIDSAGTATTVDTITISGSGYLGFAIRTGLVSSFNPLLTYKLYDPSEELLGTYSPSSSRQRKVFCNFW